MLTGWDIYWIMRLNGVHYFFSFMVVAAIVAIVILIATFMTSVNVEDERLRRITKKYMIITFIVTLLFSFLCILTPTTEELITIRMLPKIISAKDIKNSPLMTATFIKNWLKNNKE